VRALAVSTKERSPAVPDLPSIHEAGVPGYDKGGWTGMFAQSQVPEAIVARIYQAVTKVMKDPDAVKKLAEDGLVAVAEPAAGVLEVRAVRDHRVEQARRRDEAHEDLAGQALTEEPVMGHASGSGVRRA
jgi:hypothetical protein